jgi:hypothetical protein
MLFKLSVPGRRKSVVLGAAIVLGGPPLGFQLSVLFQAV